MHRFGGHSNVAPLRRVLLRTPADAWRSQEHCNDSWKALAFTGRPDIDVAAHQHAQYREWLEKDKVDVELLPADTVAPGDHSATTMDSIYTYDPVLMTNAGAVLLAMGKPARRTEPALIKQWCRENSVPVLGKLDGDAALEGGDMFWLDENCLVVGRGYRTNAEGVRQLRAILKAHVPSVHVEEVHLPHWRGEADLLHLLSVISPLDRDLAVVYAPLMPVPLMEELTRRGWDLVEVPSEEEFLKQASNVLVSRPRRALMLDGSPRTAAALRDAGCDLTVLEGSDVSHKGCGGPTCLHQALWRSWGRA